MIEHELQDQLILKNLLRFKIGEARLHNKKGMSKKDKSFRGL